MEFQVQNQRPNGVVRMLRPNDVVRLLGDEIFCHCDDCHSDDCHSDAQTVSTLLELEEVVYQ